MNEYLKNLVRGVGKDRALIITKSRMESSSPKNWSSLPKGPVFYNKPRHGGDEVINVKELTKLHGWWTQAYHILKKGLL